MYFSGDTNTPVEPTEGFNCDHLFDSLTVQSFGSKFDGSSRNQYCIWKGLNTLVITFGYGATVVPRDILRFKLNQTDCSVWICHLQKDGRLPFTSNLTLAVPSVNINAFPVAVVEAPANVGLCDDITMASSSTGGYGRMLWHKWKLPEYIQRICPNIVTNASDLRIIGRCTAELPMTKLSFYLVVTNWLSLSDFLNISITYTANVIPRVFVRGSNIYRFSRINTLEIPIDVSIPKCHPNQSYALEYSWKQETIGKPTDYGWEENVSVNYHLLTLDETQTRAKRLVIPPNSTLWGMYYMFTVSVSHHGAVSNSTVVGVKVDDRPLPKAKESDELIFSFATRNEILLTQVFNFFVDLKESQSWWHSLGSTEDEAISATYNISWYCMLASTTGNLHPCSIPMIDFDNKVKLSFSSNETLKYFVGLTRYIFTARVQYFNKTVENSISIFVEERRYPVVTVFPGTVSLTQGDQMTFTVSITKSSDIGTGVILKDENIFSFYNVTWRTSPALTDYAYAFTSYANTATLDSRQITSDFLDEVVIFVQIVPLVTGESFFEGPVTKRVTVSINLPPRMGTCAVSPTTGQPSTTMFTVQCADWVSDTELEYQFGYAKKNSPVGGDSPLLTWTRSSKHKFMIGPGEFTIISQIKDERGAVVEIFSDISVEYNHKQEEAIQADQVKYVQTLTESVEKTIFNAASAGDISAVFSKIAEVDPAIDNLRSYSTGGRNEMDIDVLAELFRLKQNMIASIGLLLSSSTPTLSSLYATISAQKYLVMDWTLLTESSVKLVAGQLETLISTTSEVLSEEYVSKFPPTTVEKLVESSNSMLRVAYENGLSNMSLSQRLRDSGSTSLKESLTDTQPGQVGFGKLNNNGYSQYSAKRVAADEFSSCSTSNTWMPDLIPAFHNSKSGDCITFIDNQDYGFEGMRRPQTEIHADNQQVISIDLYHSSDRTVENSVIVDSLDMCNPVVITLDSEVVPGTNYRNVTEQIALALNNSNSNETMTYRIPSCESRHGFGDSWLNTGCSLIRWEENRTWCACTHLTSISARPKDLSISFSKILKNRNTLPITYETVKNHPIAPFCAVILILLLIRLLPEVQMRSNDRELLAQPYIFSNRGFEKIVLHSAFYKRYQALARKGTCRRLCNLFVWEIRNNHPIFGIWLRDMGTNFTGHQRVIVVFVGLGTSLATEAFFYGVTWSQPVEEILTTAVVSGLVSIIPFIAKLAMKKHKTNILDDVFEVEKSRMENCRLSCRYMSCCCLCIFCNRGRHITKRSTFFPGDLRDSLIKTNINTFRISDRRQAIIIPKSSANEGFNSKKGEVLQKDSKEYNTLLKWQLYYLKKEHQCPLCLRKFSWPGCMRKFSWTVQLIYLIGCSVAIITYGVNFDRDEIVESDPKIIAETETQCQTRKLENVTLHTDVAVDSILELAASNISAVMANSAFRRYPDPMVEIYSKNRSESFRFLSSAIVAWIVGVFILPFIKHLFAAISTLLIYRPFSKSAELISTEPSFCKDNFMKEAEPLKKEDFKFIFLLFPTDLPIEISGIAVPRGQRVIKKRGCKSIMWGCGGYFDN